MQNFSKKIVVEPNCRGGVSTSVVTLGDKATKSKQERAMPSPFVHVLRHLHDDQNLVYLAARLQNYAEVTDARLESLRQAVRESDSSAITTISQALTDTTGKLGAIRMMKICIALQMVARRGFVEKARDLVSELELEYARFKENLIYAVG